MKFRFWIALVAQLALFAALNCFDDWTFEFMPVKFVAAAVLCGLTYLVAASEFPATGTRKALLIFWIVTIVLRLFALPLNVSNETWRYQADGVIQRGGYNPYEIAPDDPRVVGDIPEFSRVPRSDEPASFAPGAELFFRFIPATKNALPLKLIFGAAELLTILLLLRLTDVRTAAWFAWNPLCAYSFFGAAHFDSLLLLCLAWVISSLTIFEQQPRWPFALAASAAFGCALALRPIAIVLLLPVVFALGRKSPATILSLAVPACAAAAFRFPISGFHNLFGDFNHITRLNDLVWWLLEDTIIPNWHQQYYRYDVIILVSAVVLGLIFLRKWQRGMLWTLGALILLAPVLHAWYVTWILPIATWRRVYGWHFLAVTIFAYYLFFNERLFALPWHAEPWMRGMIVLPVLFAVAALGWQRLSQRPVS